MKGPEPDLNFGKTHQKQKQKTKPLDPKPQTPKKAPSPPIKKN